jgi:hypothetical protein
MYSDYKIREINGIWSTKKIVSEKSETKINKDQNELKRNHHKFNFSSFIKTIRSISSALGYGVELSKKLVILQKWQVRFERKAYFIAVSLKFQEHEYFGEFQFQVITFFLLLHIIIFLVYLHEILNFLLI